VGGQLGQGRQPRNTLGESPWSINPAAFSFHGAIHQTLADVHCMMSVHTTATVAVCRLDDGLSFTNFYVTQLCRQVAYRDFEGITVHQEEGQRILAHAAVKAGSLPSSPAPTPGRRRPPNPRDFKMSNRRRCATTGRW
jgi:hypothetical protein